MSPHRIHLSVVSLLTQILTASLKASLSSNDLVYDSRTRSLLRSLSNLLRDGAQNTFGINVQETKPIIDDPLRMCSEKESTQPIESIPAIPERNFILPEVEYLVVKELIMESQETLNASPPKVSSRDSSETQAKKRKKWLLIGAGALGSGALIAVTGGLAAPFIGAGLISAAGALGLGSVVVAGGFLTTSMGALMLAGENSIIFLVQKLV